MRSEQFYNRLIAAGFGPFTGVPCSLVRGLITYVEQASDSKYFIATSEGEAMGIAGGLALAGRTPVVLMQNDGYGNAVNPLSSLQLVYNLPVLMLITWRAQPGAKPDAVQHHIMGETLLELLDTFKIPYRILEADPDLATEQLAAAQSYMQAENKPFALIIRRGIIEQQPLGQHDRDPQKPLRIDFLNVLAAAAAANSVMLGTTGFTGRELKQAVSRPGTFYTAGSMGCIGSLALGIAAEHAERTTYVLDGDGALLMKLGTLATIGHYRPGNFVHILFDNGRYESTGGQSTVSATTDFPAVAAACGYLAAESVDSLDQFRAFIAKYRATEGPVFCHVKVQPGTLPNLKRPAETPVELRDQFWKFLGVNRERQGP